MALHSAMSFAYKQTRTGTGAPFVPRVCGGGWPRMADPMARLTAALSPYSR